MTMVTIERQSSTNVEAGVRGGPEEVSSYSSSISAKVFDRGRSEAAGQEGRKQASMCVNETERERGGEGGVRKLWS